MKLAGTRWALEDAQRGTGSVLERTMGVYPSLKAAKDAAQDATAAGMWWENGKLTPTST